MPFTYGVQDLQKVIDRVPATKKDFAKSLVSATYVLSDKQLYWVDKLTQLALGQGNHERKTADVGDMTGIIELFDRAKQHLKFPAIVLSCPGAETLRINVAGQSARVPGSVNVASYEHHGDNRTWFGRVHRNGKYEASASGEAIIGIISARLREFAAHPTAVAAEHGRLTGRCCFCNQGLKDERSTEVGYGPVCAKHYGLAWG